MEIENQVTYGKQIDDLLVKEKQARLGNDNPESEKILTGIIKICYDLKEYEKMFELMLLLSKRRGQSKKAQISMVQQCMEYVKKINDQNIKIKLIETIKDVCDKKIFLEVEYARCCLLLVKHKEDDNMIEQAASILQEVQVETYGSMDKREKLEFILYQMYIMIKKKDYVRLLIISKKINEENLDNKEILDLKLTYYAYLIEYYNHENLLFEVAKCYQKIFKTLDNPDSPKDLPTTVDYGYGRKFDISYKNILENYIMYLVISSYSSEQEKIIEDIQKTFQHKFQNHPQLKYIIDQFLLRELISTDTSSFNVSHFTLFNPSVTEFADQHMKAFRKQLVQKNIRNIQKYYEKITIRRFAQLLKVNEEEVENELCEMINEGVVSCKVDRLDGQVCFRLKQNENAVLNAWSNDTNRVLDLIDQTCNLIKQQEEEMLAKK